VLSNSQPVLTPPQRKDAPPAKNLRAYLPAAPTGH